MNIIKALLSLIFIVLLAVVLIPVSILIGIPATYYALIKTSFQKIKKGYDSVKIN